MIKPSPLGSLSADHPCLWGDIALTPAASLVIERKARLLPTRRTGRADPWWTTRKQGGLDAEGRTIEALNDLRGYRPIYQLPTELPSQPLKGGKQRGLVLYGGTVFEHFGHLLLDLSRLYQLLPLFRKSREPIWFHYPSLGEGESITHPLVNDWFECLGIIKRVRVVRRTLQCEHLISSEVLYRDRRFVSTDFPLAARRALAPKLRRKLLSLQAESPRIAYLSRHQLSSGTTYFEGEQEVVEALKKISNIDIICPEELTIEFKLSLYRRYHLVAGFAQAALLLKYFAPFRKQSELAEQVLFVAGPQSLNSNWVNLDKAFGFGDKVVDCSLTQELAEYPESKAFQRHNRFNTGLVIDTMRELAGR